MKVVDLKTTRKGKDTVSALPEQRLIIVNMAKSLEDIRARIFVCPSDEGAFQAGHIHFPAKYIACYVQAGAKYVGQVAACVRINKVGPAEFLWGYGSEEESVYIQRAKDALKATLTLNRVPPRLIFLIENLSATDFVHDSGTSLLASKVYFDVTTLGPTDVKDLADKLRTTVWSTLPKWKPD